MSSADLTDSERKFLETAMTCLKSPPELDTAKLAEKLGIKPKSVTNKWWEIKKKLWGNANHTPVATPSKGGDDDDADAASTGNKRKRTVADAGDGASPAPKARKPRAKKEPGAAGKAKAGKKVKPEAKVEAKVESEEEDEKKDGIVGSDDDTDTGEV
ncbi:hypothetical protein V8F06_000372 [Rhypophila decipiens]